MRKRRIKNMILKMLTWTAGIAALLAVCSVDSDDNTIPIIVCGVCASWLLLMYAANCDR